MPKRSLDTFQASSGSAELGTQVSPQIVGLANGNILIAWEERTDGAVATEDGIDIVARIYDPMGAPTSDFFLVNTARSEDNEQDFDIAPTSDGGFVVVYLDDDLATPDNAALIWQRHDALGILTAHTEIAAETATRSDISDANVSVNLADDSSYITWEDIDGSSSGVAGIRVDDRGLAATSVFDAAPNTPDRERDIDNAVLSNGNLVSVYEESDGADVGIEYLIADPSGGLVAHLSNVDPLGRDPEVAALADGGFVVAWGDITGSSIADDIAYRVFEADGTPRTAILTAAGTSDRENEPEVVGLPQGGFALYWDNDTDDTTELQVFTAEGAADGATVVVDSGGISAPDLGVTGDGRLLLASAILGPDFDYDILASVWDPRGAHVSGPDLGDAPGVFVSPTTLTAPAGGGMVTAGDRASTLTGSDQADTLLGGRGSDWIDGGNGADELRSTAGNDTMIGGDDGSDDYFVGGSGHETMIDGPGNDTMIARAGNDTLSSGGGNDTLVGGPGDDVLHAFGGADEILAQGDDDLVFAGTGADFVAGGAGNDTLRGEGDDDILLGQGDADEIYGGDGHDTMNGGGGADLLVGQPGEDVLDGFVGVDTLRGGGDNDTYVFSDASHTGVGAGNRDVIGTWGQGADRIDLSAIDADPSTAGDDAFAFLGGGGHTGAGGTLRVYADAGSTIVAGDLDGDSLDDFQIQIVGTVSLTAADFIL